MRRSVEKVHVLRLRRAPAFALLAACALSSCTCGDNGDTASPPAAAASEVSLIVSYGSEKKTWFEEQARAFAASYPVEGTFWSDHPFSVLDAPWVGADEREAAQAFLSVLKARPAQERALQAWLPQAFAAALARAGARRCCWRGLSRFPSTSEAYRASPP